MIEREKLFKQVRALPELEQARIVEALVDMKTGEPYQLTQDELSVVALLALVGKSATEWYIVKRDGREQTEFRDPQIVPIESGDEFLTVSTGATPVS